MNPYRALQSENEWPKNPFLIHEDLLVSAAVAGTTRPSLNSVDAPPGAPSVQSIESLKIEKMPEMCFRNRYP